MHLYNILHGYTLKTATTSPKRMGAGLPDWYGKFGKCASPTQVDRKHIACQAHQGGGSDLLETKVDLRLSSARPIGEANHSSWNLKWIEQILGAVANRK